MDTVQDIVGLLVLHNLPVAEMDFPKLMVDLQQKGRVAVSVIVKVIDSFKEKILEANEMMLFKEIVTNLLQELDPEIIAWRPISSAPLTAKQLIEEVNSSTDLGLQYSSDLLRVSRDLLQRKAKLRIAPDMVMNMGD